MGDSDGQLPDWRTISAGTKVRVALWLATEVGEGGTFRIQDLRAAMPGIEQIDRRMRDLRPVGWELETYRENPRLRADELKLARIGDHVWDPAYQQKRTAIPNRLRLQVMERDGFRCASCGVGGGETYPDDNSQTAQLMVRAVDASGPDAGSRSHLVTQCRRCSKAGGLPRLHASNARAAVSELAPEDRALLLAWLNASSEELLPAVKAYLACRQLSTSERHAIVAELREELARE